MSVNAIKGESMTPIVAGAVGMMGFLTHSFFLLSVLPAILGSAYSVYMSWQRNREGGAHPVNASDFLFGFVSAAAFGGLAGWYFASLLPGDAKAALCLMTFVFSLWGTKLLRSLHKTNWDMGAWLKGILDGIAKSRSGGGDDDRQA